jgi:starch phosphorylase
MAVDYLNKFYSRACEHNKRLSANDRALACELAQWKLRVSEIWPSVSLRRIDEQQERILSGATLPIRVSANLGGLSPDDVIVECVVGRFSKTQEFTPHQHYILAPTGEQGKGETVFGIDLMPELPGQQFYKLRMYPHHKALANRFETGYMIWL